MSTEGVLFILPSGAAAELKDLKRIMEETNPDVKEVLCAIGSFWGGATSGSVQLLEECILTRHKLEVVMDKRAHLLSLFRKYKATPPQGLVSLEDRLECGGEDVEELAAALMAASTPSSGGRLQNTEGNLFTASDVGKSADTVVKRMDELRNRIDEIKNKVSQVSGQIFVKLDNYLRKLQEKVSASETTIAHAEAQLTHSAESVVDPLFLYPYKLSVTAPDYFLLGRTPKKGGEEGDKLTKQPPQVPVLPTSSMVAPPKNGNTDSTPILGAPTRNSKEVKREPGKKSHTRSANATSPPVKKSRKTATSEKKGEELRTARLQASEASPKTARQHSPRTDKGSSDSESDKEEDKTADQ
ncbi:unnamed protein product, partial [Mesorhabditis spiculigera]